MTYNKMAGSVGDPVSVINSVVQKLGYSKLKRYSFYLCMDLGIDLPQLKQTTTDAIVRVPNI